MVVPVLADWCSIDLVKKDGTIELFTVAHKDPKKIKWAKQLREKNPTDPNANRGVPQVIRTGKSEIFSQISDELLAQSAKSEAELKLLQKLALSSVMIVPLVRQKKVLGAITFITTKESNISYDLNDLRFAEDFASRVAMALENAYLYEAAKKEIQERKEAEEDLLKSEARFIKLMSSSIIGIAIVNLKGNILDTNEAFLRMIGYTQKDFKKKKISWRDLTPPEFHPVDQFAIQELEEYGECTPYEKEYIRKDGTKLPILLGGVMLEKDIGSCVTFILDITEQKKLEQRKDEFISIASHELKTPITSIKALSQILIKKYQNSGDEKLLSYLGRMNSELERLKHLVASLLDVSVIQSGEIEYQPEVIVLQDLVNETVENMQLTTESHRIEKEGQTSARIIGDRYRLTQVLINLISNAIKYSPTEKKVLIKIYEEDKNAIIAVHDYGIGIPEDQQRQIFHRFYRANTSPQYVFGLGLGLYIASQIVRRHKGQLRVKSKYGEGSTFSLSLPIATKKQLEKFSQKNV
jgi:PAS domain S-box-containing protein